MLRAREVFASLESDRVLRQAMKQRLYSKPEKVQGGDQKDSPQKVQKEGQEEGYCCVRGAGGAIRKSQQNRALNRSR